MKRTASTLLHTKLQNLLTLIMPDNIDTVSYELKVEKMIALALAGMGFWFCYGSNGKGYDFLGDYFDALKLGFCILAAFVGFRVLGKGILGPAVLCGLIALIYNPFFKLDLDSDSWQAVHLAAAISFLWVVFKFRSISKLMSPESVEKRRWSEAMARVVNNAEVPPPPGGFSAVEKMTDGSKNLTSEVEQSMERVMEAMRYQQETGQFPPGFIENIKRGRAIIDAQKGRADSD